MTTSLVQGNVDCFAKTTPAAVLRPSAQAEERSARSRQPAQNLRTALAPCATATACPARDPWRGMGRRERLRSGGRKRPSAPRAARPREGGCYAADSESDFVADASDSDYLYIADDSTSDYNTHLIAYKYATDSDSGPCRNHQLHCPPRCRNRSPLGQPGLSGTNRDLSLSPVHAPVPPDPQLGDAAAGAARPPPGPGSSLSPEPLA